MSDAQEVTLIAIVRPADGKHDRFQQLTEEYAEYVHQNEAGTLQFLLHKEDGEGRYALVERYTSKEDLDAHREDPKHKELFRTFAEEAILSEPPILFVGNAVAGHKTR